MRTHLTFSALTLTALTLLAAGSGSAQQLTRSKALRLLAAAPQFSRPSFISLHRKAYLPPCTAESVPEHSWDLDRPNLTAIKIGILTLRPIVPPTLLRECIPYISASHVEEAKTWQECGGTLRIPIGRAKPVEVTGILAGGALGGNVAEVEFRWRLELNEIGTRFAKVWPQGSYEKTVSTEDRPETASFALYDDGWRLGRIGHAYGGSDEPTCGPVSPRWFAQGAAPAPAGGTTPAAAGGFSAKLGIDTTALIRTPSGLRYQDVTVGQGEPAAAGDTVTVRFKAWVSDGRGLQETWLKWSLILDSGQLRLGFYEGVVGMKPGGRRKLVVPPALLPSSGGTPLVDTVVYEVELLQSPSPSDLDALSGTFFPVNPLPAGFQDFGYLTLIIEEPKPRGSVWQPGGLGQGDRALEMRNVHLNGKQFSFESAQQDGVSFAFAGEFVQQGKSVLLRGHLKRLSSGGTQEADVELYLRGPEGGG
jgi:FKBP-type peptidyl-prolyl cis-trans isomerase FkpA